MTTTSNAQCHFLYDDLQEWTDCAKKLGEVQNFLGTSWHEDVIVVKAFYRNEYGSCVPFVEVLGWLLKTKASIFLKFVHALLSSAVSKTSKILMPVS